MPRRSKRSKHCFEIRKKEKEKGLTRRTAITEERNEISQQEDMKHIALYQGLATTSSDHEPTTFTPKGFLIRSSLLMMEDDDDKENEEEKIEELKSNLILISQKRLMELVSSRGIAGCKYKKKYDIKIIRDGFEASINRFCHICALKKPNRHEKCPPLHSFGKKIRKKNF